MQHQILHFLRLHSAKPYNINAIRLSTVKSVHTMPCVLQIKKTPVQTGLVANLQCNEHTTASVEFLIVLGSTGLSVEGSIPAPTRCQQQFGISNESCDNLISDNHTQFQHQIPL